MPIDSYEQGLVDEAIAKGIELLGGISKFIGRDEKILLKPNLLHGALPQRAITTHPAVFGAVAKLLRDEGYEHIAYGDSPGSPLNSPSKTATICGITEAADRFGLEEAEMDTGSMVRYSEGIRSKNFCICDGAMQADAIINICKMKTHALERLTGAVKNMYGCIWGLNKSAGHLAHSNSYAFADMLADLNMLLKPRLHVMDGILAMEGNGPTSGDPIQMNVVLVSDDPVALDAVFAYLVAVDPATVPTCVSGEKVGLGTYDAEQIVVATPDGELSVLQAAEKYGNPDFNVDRQKLKRSLLVKLVPLIPGMQDKPKLDSSKCVACGLCEQVCPVKEKAVHAGSGQKAQFNYKKCIKCFCCQEMCPKKAIVVHRSAIKRVLGPKRAKGEK